MPLNVVKTLRTVLCLVFLAECTGLLAASDLEERLAKWQPIEIPARHDLSPRETKMVEKLVQASMHLEAIYWEQNDRDGLALYRSLACSTTPRDLALRKLLMIHGGRFDILDGNRPFVGEESQPHGKGFYSSGITQAEIEKYVISHPEQKNSLYSPYTVIRRDGKRLRAVPYHMAYRTHLKMAAKNLRLAADLADEPAFARFLRLRADALLTDRYFASDMAWLDLANPKFDVVFAPYEVYLDEVLGVKGAYGAVVAIRNEAETRKLEVYQRHVADIQDSLPLRAEDKPSKKGLRVSMEVMDTLYRAGDVRHGYVSVATNLPNDAEVHLRKGSKRIFFKDFVDARFTHILLPLAKHFLRADWAAKVNAADYAAVLVMHEVGHGIGPAFARIEGKRVAIPEALGPIYAPLEEAKATITGLYGLAWMVDQGVLPKQAMDEYYAAALSGTFRAIRFGTTQAHGRAQMMEFNYLREQGALQRDADGLYHLDTVKMRSAVAALAKELLEIEASGDRARAEALFAKYGTMPDDFVTAFASLSKVPVDVTPVRFPYPEYADHSVGACKEK